MNGHTHKGANMDKSLKYGHITESILKKGTWKVWVTSNFGTGYLRGGHAWKTKAGAERALVEYLERTF